MSATRVFIARLAGCGVFDPAGDRVGKVIDVLVAYRKTSAPRVTGLMVEITGRRRVFVPIARITSIANGQVITTGLIDLRRFSVRGGEQRVIAEMLGRKVTLKDGSGTATIEDVAIEVAKSHDWLITEVFLRRPKTSASPFARGATLFSSWDQISESKDAEAQSAEALIATYSELRPADLANALLDLPDERMIEVAEELDDERLADVLEELPEEEQLDIIQELDDERAAEVLDLMEPDDAADLMANLSEERTEAIFELMDEEEAEDIRMLMQFDEFTAGGLMTTEPLICAADMTVAEAMALIRRKSVAPVLAAQVFVTLPPYETATGRFLGVVHFQRMLRYPPHERLGTLLDTELEPLKPTTHISVIHRTLATYNLVALPVVDAEQRLIGVVTVDDVLDHLLPDDWRTEDEERCTMAKDRFDAPIGTRKSFVPRIRVNQEQFGRASEAFARAMGTGSFLIGMTIFVAIWLTWNTLAPESAQFDPKSLNYTLLTLILSMQASYAAPLILLAQNRQDDRDRVKFEQDRQRAERNLADTEYLAREVVALRLAMKDLATKEFVRDELRDLVKELAEELKEKPAKKTK